MATSSRKIGGGARAHPKEAPQVESIYALVNQGKIDLPPPRVPGVSNTVGSGPRSPNKPPAPMDHRNSSQVSNMLNPVKSDREAMIRKGLAPRNHAKNNAIAIREASSRNQLKKLEQEAVAAQPPKRPAGFVPKSVHNRPTMSPGGGSSRDYVRENAIDASANAKPAYEAPAREDWRQKENYGKVPAYLRERQVELAEAAARRAAEEEAESIPPGMRLMPESERLQTLELLKQSRMDTEQKIQKLPFTCETPSQIKAKNDLEKRLQEIEEAERAFSRKKVFVRI